MVLKILAIATVVAGFLFVLSFLLAFRVFVKMLMEAQDDE